MKAVRFSDVTDFFFDPEKSRNLRKERKFGFEDVIHLIEQGEDVRIIEHPNPKYAHQHICEIEIDGYVYIMPFVAKGNEVFLKTLYPSRKATKRRKGTGKNEKDKTKHA